MKDIVQCEVDEVINEICKTHPAKSDLAVVAEEYAHALNKAARRLNIQYNFDDDFNERAFKMKVHEFVGLLL